MGFFIRSSTFIFLRISFRDKSKKAPELRGRIRKKAAHLYRNTRPEELYTSPNKLILNKSESASLGAIVWRKYELKL